MKDWIDEAAIVGYFQLASQGKREEIHDENPERRCIHRDSIADETPFVQTQFASRSNDYLSTGSFAELSTLST